MESVNRMTNRETEYTEVHNSIRHMVDFRAKTFSFNLALNAALFAAVFQYLTDLNAKIAMSALGLCTTILLGFVDNRIYLVLDTFIDYGKKLENELGYSFLTTTRTELGKSKMRIRSYFRMIYGLIAAIWVFQIARLAL